LGGGAGMPQAPVVGTGVLIYHGDGGFEEDYFGSGAIAYRGWIDIAAPRSVDIATSWPGALDAYGTVVLVAMGARDGGATFSIEHQDLLAVWTEAGGTLVLLQDYDRAYGNNDVEASNAVVNGFLARLALPIVVTGSLVNTTMMTLAAGHPVADGLGTVVCGGGFGTMTAGTPVTVVGVIEGGGTGLAVASLGDGSVVVLSDLDCLSDWMPNDGNRGLIRNILAL
jgi:hypothetical protein